jgi:hypothetical protein
MAVVAKIAGVRPANANPENNVENVFMVFTPQPAGR